MHDRSPVPLPPSSRSKGHYDPIKYQFWPTEVHPLFFPGNGGFVKKGKKRGGITSILALDSIYHCAGSVAVYRVALAVGEEGCTNQLSVLPLYTPILTIYQLSPKKVRKDTKVEIN